MTTDNLFAINRLFSFLFIFYQSSFDLNRFNLVMVAIILVVKPLLAHQSNLLIQHTSFICERSVHICSDILFAFRTVFILHKLHY